VPVNFYGFYAIGNLPMGDKFAYAQGRGAFIQTDDDAKISVATVGDRPPSKVHCGYALRPLLWQRDARIAAEEGDLDGCDGTNEAALTGVNSVLEHSLADVAPGTKKSISFPATVAVAADKVSVKSEFVINRKDWGIVYPGMADDLIRDEVVVKLDLNAPVAK